MCSNGVWYDTLAALIPQSDESLEPSESSTLPAILGTFLALSLAALVCVIVFLCWFIAKYRQEKRIYDMPLQTIE